jgi:hypothetical protein
VDHRLFSPALAAPIVAAMTAWVSLNPYFFWGSSRALLLASILTASVAGFLYLEGVRPRWRSLEFAGVLLLSIFLVYVTVLPRLLGGHVKWVFALPTLWLLALMDGEGRRRALTGFATIFAITLIPGLVVSVLASCGVPLTFGTIPAANPAMASYGIRMLVLPGTLFVESNSLLLPWGGVLFRLCGMYDEPGMVGTVAGLLLAADRYRFRQWRVSVLYLAGVLSFSLAFAVLTTLGLIARVALGRRLLDLMPIIPVLCAASLATGVVSIATAPGTESVITVVETPLVPVEGTSGAARHKLLAGSELRQMGFLDNRSLPSMEALVSDYLAGGPPVWLFGVGSDASVVRGGVSQTWKRLLTDYGAIGFVLLAIALALITGSSLLAHPSAWVAVFLTLYGMSIYQRPIVWMPYALLILLCGPAMAKLEPQRGSRPYGPT